jgi:putative Holliday junction resolvase
MTNDAGTSPRARRVLALDVGDRRIGVAVSDELGLTAQGVTTIHRRSWAADLDDIARLVETWRAETIVVGLPLTLEGAIGPRAQTVQAFIKRLESAVGVPILTWMTLSTVTAERVLIDANLSRAKRRGVIDKTAAVVILQHFSIPRAGRHRREPTVSRVPRPAAPIDTPPVSWSCSDVGVRHPRRRVSPAPPGSGLVAERFEIADHETLSQVAARLGGRMIETASTSSRSGG